MPEKPTEKSLKDKALGYAIMAESFKRYLRDQGDIDLPKYQARKIDFVRKGERVNDKRIEEKIKSGRVTDRNKKEFSLARDLKDGQEIELREAPFEKVFNQKDHELKGLQKTFGTIDFETGARLKANRKGNTIRIDGVAEKGFEDIYDFDEDHIVHGKGTPYKIRSRWEQPFSATLIVEKDEIKSSHFQWGRDK